MRIDTLIVKWYLLYVVFCLLIGLLLFRRMIDPFVAILIPIGLSSFVAKKAHKKSETILVFVFVFERASRSVGICVL
jgi:hypothetical protein